MEFSSDELTAKKAIEFSQWISTRSEFDVSCTHADNLKVLDNLNGDTKVHYCYSCNRIADFIKL